MYLRVLETHCRVKEVRHQGGIKDGCVSPLIAVKNRQNSSMVIDAETGYLWEKLAERGTRKPSGD